MRRLLELAEAALGAEEKCMLCSVVRLQGSGYGRIGARLLLTESGQRLGYISGGCLERDLCRRVWSEASLAPRLMAFDTRGETPSSSRYNTGCRGIVTVLCQPLNSTDSPFYRVASRVVQQRQSARLLTVYHSTSSEICAGDALALFEDGTSVGTLRTEEYDYWARQLIEHGQAPFTATIHSLPNNSTLQVSVELLEPPKRLVIFGSGDDVPPVVQSALNLGWEVCVVGRQPLAGSTRIAGLRQHVMDWESSSQLGLVDAHSDVLLMTHDLNAAIEILRWLLNHSVKSIGSLGSKHRLARIIAELYRHGFTNAAELADRIRCPIGLDIGAIGPEEIAVSITAELIAMERGKSGQTLAERTGSVHDSVPHLEINFRSPAHPLIDLCAHDRIAPLHS